MLRHPCPNSSIAMGDAGGFEARLAMQVVWNSVSIFQVPLARASRGNRLTFLHDAQV